MHPLKIERSNRWSDIFNSRILVRLTVPSSDEGAGRRHALAAVDAMDVLSPLSAARG